MYRQVPFASWVPKPLSIFLNVIFLLPLMTVNGVYSANATDIAGGLGMYTEFISMSNNALYIGMGLAMLIVFRFKMRFRSKEIMVVSTVLIAAISYMNGTTDNPYVIVVGSLMMGFLKIFAMMELITPLMFTITPIGDRGTFYSVFYPMAICLGQLAAYIFASLISDSNYQAPYFVMGAMMLGISLLSIIFQHNDRFSFKKPLYQIDWLTIIMMAIAAMNLNVFLTFMKQQGWFASPYIIYAGIISVVFFALTVYRQKFVKRKLYNFSVFYKYSNVAHSIVLLLFLGLFLSVSSLYTQYSAGVLGYSNLVSSRVNLWMIPGIIVAGMLAYLGFKNKWKLKYFIAFGFICFFLHCLILYLIIQPQMDIRYIEYSMLIKGLGMGVLYIGIWFYASSKLGLDDLFGAMSILLMVRSFLGTAIGGSLLGWAAYQSQLQSLSDISVNLDSGFFSDGMSMYKNISLNALMASIKIVLGYLCWMIVPILIFVMFHHYGEFNIRRVVLFRKVIKGDSIKGYKI